jgi:hypothetical protein
MFEKDIPHSTAFYVSVKILAYAEISNANGSMNDRENLNLATEGDRELRE